MAPILRHSNSISCNLVGRVAPTPVVRRAVHIANGPYCRPTVAESTPQDHEEKIKPFDEMPTRCSNSFQFAFDIFNVFRRGLLTRPDLMVQENVDKYGPIMRNYMPYEFIVQITDPKLVEKVFRAEGKYPKRMEIKPWKDYRVTRNIPLGLFLHDGKAWHRNRQAVGKRILKPVEMAQFIPAMVAITDDTIARLRRMRIGDGDRKDIIPDVEEELFKWSMEGAVQVLLDQRLGLLSDHIDKQSQSFIDAIQEVFATTLDLFIFGDLHKRFNSKSWRRHVAGWDTTIAVTKNLIEDRVDDMMSAKEKGSELQTDTFLGALISNSDLTRDEIFGNLSELIGAAIDTTSYTIVWTLYYLAHYPDTQSKLREEVCGALPAGKPITQEDLAKLVYMKKVIKESMRMKPVINGLTRKLENDIVLQGYHIPAKTTIAVQLYPMARDPNYFEDPLEFRPERWDRSGNSNKDDKLHNAFASLPFGFGTRMCIGRRFAEQEMHLLLAEIIRQFDVIPTKTVDITHRLLVIPAEPVDLKFVDRN